MSRRVLLLHGQPGGARDWDRVVAAIGPRMDSIVPTRPGWDGSSVAAGLSENAAAALAVMDAQGVDRATVVGHSFGGAVAAWLAAAWPERVRALVLVAPSANLASLVWLDHLLATPIVGYVVGAIAFGGAGIAIGAQPARRRLAGALELEAGYLASTSGILSSRSSWRAFYVEQRALVRDLPALEERLGRILAPTTIISGSADRIVPLSATRRLAAQIPGSHLNVLRGAGHLLPLRRADAVAEAIVAASV